MPSKYKVDRAVYSFELLSKDYQEEEPNINVAKSIKNKLKCKTKSPTKIGQMIFPLPFILMSFYKVKFLLYDFISGITMLVFHIPQGMAYGLLSGLQPINGLYSSFVPALVYAFFGTSRHLSIGTFSLMSLLSRVPIDREVNEADFFATNSTNGTLGNYDLSDLEMEKLRVSIATTFLTGLIQLVMGMCRLGFIITFLSDALIDGFTTAASFHIFMAQVGGLLGYTPQRVSGIGELPQKVYLIAKHINQVNWATLLISLICIGILLLFSEWLNPIIKKKLKFPFPIQFVLVVFGTLISYLVNFESRFGVKIVGPIPSGMPMPMLPSVSYWPAVAKDAIMLAIIGFVMNAALAKVFSIKFAYDINYNQEFTSYGLCNIVGSMFRCTMSAAALARTSVVVEVGMKSQLATLVSCFMMLFVLLFIGPLFTYVPKSVLSAIIVVSLKGLMLQLKRLPTLYAVSKYDFWVWIVTFLSVLGLNIQYGLMVGFIFSLLTVMLRLQIPRCQVLGNLSDTDIYRNVKIFKDAKEIPGIKIIRYDAPLYFANAENFHSKIFSQTKLNPHKFYQNGLQLSKRDDENGIDTMNMSTHKDAEETPLKCVIIDASAINFVDNVGVRILDDIYCSYRKIGIHVFLTTPNSNVRQMLRQSNFTQENLNRVLFVSVHDAVLAALDDIARTSTITMETASAAPGMQYRYRESEEEEEEYEDRNDNNKFDKEEYRALWRSSTHAPAPALSVANLSR